MRLDHLLSKEEEVRKVRCLLLSYQNSILLVAMRSGDTPVPIPNTMVKTQAADGTALETVWESRWPPDYKKLKMKKRNKLIFTSDQRLKKILVSDD